MITLSADTAVKVFNATAIPANTFTYSDVCLLSPSRLSKLIASGSWTAVQTTGATNLYIQALGSNTPEIASFNEPISRLLLNGDGEDHVEGDAAAQPMIQLVKGADLPLYCRFYAYTDAIGGATLTAWAILR